MKMSSKTKLLLSAVTAASFAATAVPTYAQDSSDDVLDTVVVTGSRLVKKDFVSNSPVATINAVHEYASANSSRA